MSVALVQEAAEAINSGLFQTDFQPLGNSEGGRVDWWWRGHPGTVKQVKVSVERLIALPYVQVTAQYPVPVDGVLRTVSLDWKVPCDGTQTRDKVIDATTEVIVKVLELFRDILNETPPLPPVTPQIDGVNEFAETEEFDG